MLVAPPMTLRQRLAAPVAGHSLAAFRILFGALLVLDFFRFIQHERIWRYWAEPSFHFSYPGFAWVTVPPEPWLQIAWAGLGLSALLVTLGLFYRPAILALTVLFSWFFLMDAAEYLNHFYLVILYSLLLCVLPAARVWSLDAVIRRRLKRPAPQTVPRAALTILRVQTEIMLVFAGLVKLTPDWLAGEPLGLWMRERVAGLWFAPLMDQQWLIILACWLVIALHVLGAPLLLWSRTRLAIFLIYSIFHIGNAWAFNIGIFPWLTIAATTIFFAPDWPKTLWAWLCGLWQTRARLRPAGAAASAAGALGGGEGAFAAPGGIARSLPVSPSGPLQGVSRSAHAMAAGDTGHSMAPPTAAGSTLPSLSLLALVAMAVWITVQIALPLRGMAFSSEVRWSGEGHRLSWRMRIYDRVADGRFIVTDRSSGEVWVVDPDDYLTPRQTDKMLVRADLVHQFAQHLAATWQAEGREVSVRAEICKSLNGRPCQSYIDPAVDLTAVEVNPFGADPWILPLSTPLPSGI